MDCIRIRNLEIFGHHGVYSEEKRLGQKFVVCADLYLDIRPSGLSDDLKLSVNYGDVCKFMDSFMRGNTYYLIEAVAEKMAKALLVEFENVSSIRLEIKKPWAPIGLPLEEVSVVIERGWHDAYIGLGSNMGDKKDIINEALSRMEGDDDIKVLERSSLIDTKPYGKTDQPDFLNGAVHIKTMYTPLELLKCLNEIELLSGRVREEHWGPRTLDLDILLYDDIIMDTPDLTIPHYDMKNRDFVLKPLCEIASWLRHPVEGKTIREMLSSLEMKDGPASS
ncbi:MAG: 2-amino-4-hydroxy-6-hydroxymethyldihydropteridine diphosphokinase [Lachnospiraceae bacterium]|nr:2-amino-4-hydroxy-6-hydroxymethyldihydropteridine diphosphokinase [Lachnospiraceae bacterium]